VRAAGTTPENLQSLIGLLEGLREGEASSAEVMETVEREAPDLAPVVRKGLATSDPIKLITLLITILALYLQATTPAPPSADEVADAIREKPMPTYSVPAPSERRASGRRKRPPKTHGKAKQRKSRKRR
jgi:hypothetical protein